MEVLKQNFNFEYLRNTETILLLNTWLKDWLTKVKSSKKVIFSYFWPKMGAIFVAISFKNGVSITTTSWFWMYTSCKIWKKPLKYQLLCFFHNIRPNLSLLAEITKADHQLSETFFYQNSICFDWVKNLFLSLVMLFCQKSVISS